MENKVTGRLYPPAVAPEAITLPPDIWRGCPLTEPGAERIPPDSITLPPDNVTGCPCADPGAPYAVEGAPESITLPPEKVTGWPSSESPYLQCTPKRKLFVPCPFCLNKYQARRCPACKLGWLSITSILRGTTS